MTHVLVPGSFDPPTLGHLDVIAAAARLFDRVTVAVVINPAKSGLFPLPQRLELLREITDGLSISAPSGAGAPAVGGSAVTVDSFDGLLVEYCVTHGIDAIIKGIRAAGDVDYELAMAHMNSHLQDVPTLLVPSAPQHSFISSSLVKQVASYGGDVAALVAPPVAAALEAAFHPRASG